jgi:uncharacterized membrane protein
MESAKVPQRAPGELISSAAVVDARRAVKARHIVTINRPIDDVFATTRDWVTTIPDYALVNEIGNELIAWKTVGGSALKHAGSVNLRETADGVTEVRIEVDYEPPDVAFGVLFDDLTMRLLKKR